MRHPMTRRCWRAWSGGPRSGAPQRAAERRGGCRGAVATATRDADDPRDAVDPRDLMQNTGVMTLVAYQFLLSSSVSSYFLFGAGSLELRISPAGWARRSTRARRASTRRRGGGDYGGGGSTAAGFDGGGFGGGFDGGGFGGGGFDGGGG